jgi:hypothetical protein
MLGAAGTHDDFVARLLEMAKQEEVCALCGSDSTYKAGFCRHCYRVRLGLSKAKKHLAELDTNNERGCWIAKHEVRVLEQKSQLCESDGLRLRSILDGEVSGLDLEDLLRRISKRYVK